MVNTEMELDERTAGMLAALDHMEMAAQAVWLREYSYELLQVEAGAMVADIGCGTGRAVEELNALGARAVGVDPDPGMLAIARGRYPEADFRVSAAEQLPFGDGELRGYRADKVLHAMDDPGRALAEASRVLAPGGRIVLVGQDWDGIAVDSDDVELTRRLVHGVADGMPSAAATRASRTLLGDAGFADVRLEVRATVFTDTSIIGPLLGALAGSAAVSPAEAERWLREQRAREAAGRLTLMVPMYVASGVRPPGT